MTDKKRLQNVDPIDLLAENFDRRNMDDSFRADLYSATSAIIAGRRRVSLRAWASCLAIVFGLVAVLCLTILNSFHRTSPRVVARHSAPPPAVSNSKELSTGPTLANNVQPRPRLKTDGPKQLAIKSSNVNRSSQHFAGEIKRFVPAKGSQNQHSSPVRNRAPVLTLILAQGRVTDGSGRAVELGDRLPLGATVHTDKGGRASFITRKGSELTLAASSELSIESPSSVVINRGRLYCSNREKEIAQINTPAGHIRLLGTIVDASVVRKDAVAVTVIAGKVKLSNPHGTALVDAGEKSMLVAYQPPQAGLTVNTYKETGWYYGRSDYLSDFGDIAYTVLRDGLTTEIWTMKANGTGKHRVRSFIGWARDAGPWLLGERWLGVELSSTLWTTPDTRTQTASAGAGHPIVNDSVIFLDVATGRCAPIELPDGYKPIYRSYSPDQTLMAFSGSYWPTPNDPSTAEGGVWIFDRQTGKLSRVMSGWIKTPVVWAPDNRHIIVSTGQNYTEDHKLVIIDTQNGGIKDLGVCGAGASFSPDGTKIAYCGDFKTGGSWWSGVPTGGSVFVLDLSPGAAPTRVSSEESGAIEPRWSPDGSRIAYVVPFDTVCVANADGSGFKQVYSCAGNRIDKIGWAPPGDLLYVTVRNTDSLSTSLVLVAADGSGVRNTLNDTGKDSRLSPAVQKQTNKAMAAIKEAVFQYAMGEVHAYEGDIVDMRRSFSAAAGIFSRLAWNYPLSGLDVGDCLRYADAAENAASCPDEEVLAKACRYRMMLLRSRIQSTIYEHNMFAPDLGTVLQWSVGTGWQADWLSSDDEKHVMMLGCCPGNGQQCATPYVYTPPPAGEEPKVGDVIVRCPLHPDVCFTWDEDCSLLRK